MVVLLLIAFLLELVAFFSFASLALLLDINITLRVVLYLLLLSGVIAFWAIYMSPRAPNKFHGRKYYASEAIIYLIATFVLVNIFNIFVGAIFFLIWIADELFLYTKTKPSQ